MALCLSSSPPTSAPGTIGERLCSVKCSSDRPWRRRRPPVIAPPHLSRRRWVFVGRPTQSSERPRLHSSTAAPLPLRGPRSEPPPSEHYFPTWTLATSERKINKTERLSRPTDPRPQTASSAVCLHVQRLSTPKSQRGWSQHLARGVVTHRGGGISGLYVREHQNVEPVFALFVICLGFKGPVCKIFKGAQ